MKRKQDVNSEANQSFTLPAIVGTWESLNLHPTVMIYQSGKKYLLSMLHVSDNGQAQPATYEIQKEDSRYFIVSAFKRLYIDYDKAKDSLFISYYGDYLRIYQSFKLTINEYVNMELINSNSELINEFFQSMDRMLDGISRLAKESRPHLNGDKFLSNQEASKYLKVSIRILQEWRDTGVIPYIQIKGKIIYRQSDIERLLQTY